MAVELTIEMKKYNTDAAIMKVMKKEKNLPRAELLTYSFAILKNKFDL